MTFERVGWVAAAILAILAIAGCSDRGIGSLGGGGGDGGGSDGGVVVDLASRAPDLAATGDLAAVDLAPPACTSTNNSCSGALACSCCPAGGPLEHCVCSNACSSAAECTDPSRPRCEISPGSTVGFCVPNTFTCCWGCR